MRPRIRIALLQPIRILHKELNTLLIVILQVLHQQPQLPIINIPNTHKERRNVPNSLTNNILQFLLILGAVVDINIQEQEAGSKQGDDHEVFLCDLGDGFDDVEVVLDEVDDLAVEV